MQRYFAKEKKENHFILDNTDLYHIKTVMRMKENELIEVVYNGDLYICCICNVNKNIEIKIKELVEGEENNLPKITFFIPLLKEQKMDLILQKATELGVYKIVPIMLNRSVIKVKDDFDKRIHRWMKICKEASEQSKRLNIPIIENLVKIEDLKNINGLNIVCSTKEKNKNIKNIVKNNKKYDKINVVVGPEGGITDKEEQTLIKNGFIPTTLGNMIMRVETVPIYIMSVLNYEYME